MEFCLYNKAMQTATTIAGLAALTAEESKKTGTQRYQELTDYAWLTTSPSPWRVGGLVGGGLIGAAAVSPGYELAGLAVGLVLSNYAMNSLGDDWSMLKTDAVDAVVDDTGTVLGDSPLSPFAADEVGLTSQQKYDLARTYGTRGVPQVGTRSIRPPL